MESNAWIGSIISGDGLDIQTLGNIRNNGEPQLGKPIFSIKIDLSDSDRINELVELIDLIYNDNPFCFFPTLCIDSNILHNETIMKALSKPNMGFIRIIDPDYELTEADYNIINRIGDCSVIVDRSAVEPSSNNNIYTQDNVYKLNSEFVSDTDTSDLKTVFHIDHELSNYELQYLLYHVNNLDTTSVSIDVEYHNPLSYLFLINRLIAGGLSKNVKICLLGYPLDKKEDEIFKQISRTPFASNIEVKFSTCHDIVEDYNEEPMCMNRSLYSTLEDSGRESLSDYIQMIKSIDETTSYITSHNLSPLEATIYVKQYLDANFIYNPDELNHGGQSDVNIGRIFVEGNNSSKKVAVCLGFSSLTSVILRRCGIKCFRYVCEGHSRNVIRLKDDKYGIDKIATMDNTWDLYDSNGVTYNNFLLSPYDATSLYDTDFFTIPHYLITQRESAVSTAWNFRGDYDTFYHPTAEVIIPYSIRMMQLMDLFEGNELPETYEEYEDKKVELYTKGMYDRIDDNILRQAIINVSSLNRNNIIQRSTILRIDRVFEDRNNNLRRAGNPVVSRYVSEFNQYYHRPLDVINNEYVKNWLSQHGGSGSSNSNGTR